MKTFKFEGVDYNIIEEIDRNSYQSKITDITRERQIFAIVPWWVGNKFRWLKKITIKERLSIERFSDFDDGWTYQSFWKNWELDWVVEEIIN